MPTLTPAERRALRARAHALRPVVSVGQHGLTPSVLREIDVSLKAHGLIKVRVGSDDRGTREAALERICAELDAAPVQHIGKLLVIFRPIPAPTPEPTREKSAAKKAPQVRRPRTPLPRTVPRPTPSGPRSRTRNPTPAGPKHRGGATIPGRRGKFRDDETTPVSRTGKPPRSVTATMWDDDARPRRRPRTVPSIGARRGERPLPASSFGRRGSGVGQSQAKPRPAGAAHSGRRVGGALPASRSPAVNARRRRTRG